MRGKNVPCNWTINIITWSWSCLRFENTCPTGEVRNPCSTVFFPVNLVQGSISNPFWSTPILTSPSIHRGLHWEVFERLLSVTQKCLDARLDRGIPLSFRYLIYCSSALALEDLLKGPDVTGMKIPHWSHRGVVLQKCLKKGRWSLTWEARVLVVLEIAS